MKPSTAKRKGAETEELFCQYLRDNGVPNAERRHLSGQYDKGDIAGWVKSSGEDHVVVEVKSGAVLNVSQWMRELESEVTNAVADTGFIAVRPKGKPSPEDWWVMMPTGPFLDLMRRAGYL